MYYSEEFVEEVRARSDIVDIVSGYVKLQKKGSRYFGLCPFHQEKTPSFSVSADKQMYHCFGCGAGGNVFTFLMEYENYTFPETVRYLARRAGMELPSEEASRGDRARADQKTVLLEVNRLAARFYYHLLKQPQGRAGYEYLTGRKLTEDTIRHFGLGFAARTGNLLYRYLKSRGYQDDILKESGLVIVEERGGRDRFWNRVMFPIMDANSKVIGFGGRVMGEGTPKYLNSPETLLFDKGRNLYGLNFARTSREKYLLLCEGYMDVIAMHQAGFTNAVASLGTALTARHAALIRRYADRVVLAYDSDGAGVAAALRAIPILREAGIACRVLDLRPHKDPDEFISRLGTDAFRQRIEAARNSFLFEIDAMKRDYGDLEDPEQKTRFYNAIAEKLLVFPDALERDNYMQAVSREQNISYPDLKQLVNRMALRQGPRADGPDREAAGGRPKKAGKGRDDGARQSQRLLLTWLIEDPSLFDKVEGIITPEDFQEGTYRETARMVFEGHREGRLDPARILDHFIGDPEQYREVAALFNESLSADLSGEERKKAFAETVIKVRGNSLEEAGRNAADIGELQKILRARNELKSLRVSLD